MTKICFVYQFILIQTLFTSHCTLPFPIYFPNNDTNNETLLILVNPPLNVSSFKVCYTHDLESGISTEVIHVVQVCLYFFFAMLPFIQESTINCIS